MNLKDSRRLRLSEEALVWLLLTRPLAYAVAGGLVVGTLLDSAPAAGISAGTIVTAVLLWHSYIRPRL